ncbi:MAG: cytochrome c [Gammaproteobacteria bacterium]|nr:MAG: cytochrome c [Gammaproteobacteria bacterium]
MNKLNIMITAGALLMAGSAFAADTGAGKKAFAGKGCVGCHGADAKTSTNPLYPKLAGQSAAYAVKQLKAFKSGERKDPTMNAMAAMLNDTEINDISAYLESLK